MADSLIYKPHAGAQTQYMQCNADIAVYGGTAGCGKSHCLLMDASRGHRHPKFNAVIIRQTMEQIGKGPGTLWGEARDFYGPLVKKYGGQFDETRRSVRFNAPGQTRNQRPNGAQIKFSYWNLPKHKDNYQGKPFTFMAWDELTQFTEDAFWYGWSRCRIADPTVHPWMRATCNPDPNSWVRKLLDWWIGDDGFPILERSGVLRWFRRLDGQMVWYDEPQPKSRSFTFIAATPKDNPSMPKEYFESLEALPYVERMQLLYGNWDVSKLEGTFKHHKISKKGKPLRDVPKNLKWVRYWDLADTEPNAKNKTPDWTAGALVAVETRKDGEEHIYIADIRRVQLTGGQKHDFIRATAKHDQVWLKRFDPNNKYGRVLQAFEQEGGATGKEAVRTYQTKVFAGIKSIADRPSGSKVVRAERWVGHAEHALVHVIATSWHTGDDVGIKGTVIDWFDEFFGELENFPFFKKDQIDAISGAYTVATVVEKRPPQIIGSF